MIQNGEIIKCIKEYECKLIDESPKFTSIIIVNENQLEYLELCIESITKFTSEGTYEIIVVDNNSTNENKLYLKSQSHLKVIYNDDNKSQVENFNQGMKIAKGESIVLLSVDTIVTPNWLNSLQKVLYKNENIGIVAPMSNIDDILNLNNTYSDINGLLNISNTINTSNLNLYDEKTSIPGYCIIIKKGVIEKIGYLDESFNLGYFKEHDYCFRAIKEGYKVLLSKSTFIYYFSNISNITVENAYYISLYKFEQKWGINLYYSDMTRNDITNQIKNNLDDNINILEVGCSLGGTLLYLKNKYKRANVYGIELNQSVCEIIKNIFPTISNDIENIDLPYEEDYFDYIIFADVLEHLKDPWKVLMNMKKYLKKDGYIIASIPNIMHIQVINDLLKGNFTYLDAGILDKTHLRFFTQKEIYKMFNTSGYDTESITSIKINCNQEELLAIQNLCNLYGEDKQNEYETYQYIIKAKNI